MTIERIEDWSVAPFDEDGRKSQRSGYVYIVQCGRDQMKIGYSSNPKWRAKAIGYGGPATPLILAVELFHPLAHYAEVWAHRRLTAEGKLSDHGRETFAIDRTAAVAVVRWAIGQARIARPPANKPRNPGSRPGIIGRPAIDWSDDQMECMRRHWFDMRHSTNEAARLAIKSDARERKLPRIGSMSAQHIASVIGPSGRGRMRRNNKD